MWKTGHSLIKAKMKETGAPLAGEMSGHMFFADRYFGFDDAVYAAARLLEILARADRASPTCSTRCRRPSTRPSCASTATRSANSRSSRRSRSLSGAGADVDRHRRRAGRAPRRLGLMRASNTQPVLVVRADS